MKTIYLALKMIWKQKFLNLFLILTIVLSIYYLSPVLSQVIHYTVSSQTLSGLEMNHSYYLYSNPYYNKKDASLKKSIDAKIVSTAYVTEHAESYNLHSVEPSYNILSYNDTLINNFIPKMDSGIWLNATDKKDYIPIVVSKDTSLNCGELLPIELISNDKQKTFTCKVVGILKTNANVVGFTGAADNNYFTTDALLSNATDTIIIPFTNEIENFISNESYIFSANGSILYTTDDTTYENVLNDFGYAGIVTDLDSGNNRFYEQSKLIVVAMGAYFALYLTITILCLLCSNFILNINAKRLYTIYFLTGMSYIKRMKIEIFRVLLLIFVSTTISFLYLQKNGIIQSYFENINSIIILACILLYVSLIFIPVSTIFIIKNRNVSMVDSVRNLNIEI